MAINRILSGGLLDWSAFPVMQRASGAQRPRWGVSCIVCHICNIIVETMTSQASSLASEPKLGKPAWLLFILTLQGAQSAVRMRVWRALKALGTGVLRDGV